MLLEEKANGFRTAIPEGCNFVIVSMPPAVMRAYRQREQAHWSAQREAWHQASQNRKQR
jgi:hypothetical protein